MLRYILLLLTFLCVLSSDDAFCMKAEYVRALSGDTLIVLDKDTKEKHIIKLYGVEAPDEGMIGFDASRRFADSELSRSKNYLFIKEIVPQDKFGRKQGIVFLDGVSFNELTTRWGQAFVDSNECNIPECAKLYDASKEASRYRLGVWWQSGNIDESYKHKESLRIARDNPDEGYYDGIFYHKGKAGVEAEETRIVHREDFEGVGYSSRSNPSAVYVHGYTRKDGTYVRPHFRSAPNSTQYDNWSSSPNVNPYTGKRGTRTPRY